MNLSFGPSLLTRESDPGFMAPDSVGTELIESPTMVTSDLERFSQWYADYHGYVSLVVCAVGVVCNVFNVVVLTRKDMVNPTNYFLTALAVSDLLTMLSYIPYAVHFHCLYGGKITPERNTYGWAVFLMFHANFSNTTHTVSIWLAVVLAAFRYLYVRPRDGNKSIGRAGPTLLCQSLHRARVAVIMVCACSVTILLPNYVTLTIEKGNWSNSTEVIYEVTTMNTSGTSPLEMVARTNIWIQTFCVKLIPCGLMSVFGFLLIRTMHVWNRKRNELATGSNGGSGLSQKSCLNRMRSQNRTTTMLVVIVLLFLLTELPQGFLAFGSGMSDEFLNRYYFPLGDLMDIVALVNNGINFMLYCSMSKKFRTTFLKLFCTYIYTPTSMSMSRMENNGIITVRVNTCSNNLSV